jgi:hypothetical protein
LPNLTNESLRFNLEAKGFPFALSCFHYFLSKKARSLAFCVKSRFMKIVMADYEKIYNMITGEFHKLNS